MTSVCYDRGGLRLTMEGHAGAGAFGADTVCAALSMLMMTLERRMEDRAEDALPVISRGPGRFEIRCDPEDAAEELCRESFDTVAAGLALLAENRPECVSFRLTEEEEP
jgi:uncharacterized protein YsxB (DUF464 family)